MNKFVLGVLAGVCALSLLAGCSAAQLAMMQGPQNYAKSPVFDTKPVWRTAVLPPASSSPANLSHASGLYDYAGMALLRTGRFNVVDRAAVDQILAEQEFSYSGVADQSTAVSLGRLLGAEAVMMITINSIARDSFWDDDPNQRDATIHVKIISVETSEILYTAVGEGSDFEGAEGALRMAMEMALFGVQRGGMQ